jgi:hypothetical protein
MRLMLLLLCIDLCVGLRPCADGGKADDNSKNGLVKL